ncbi:MAG TPA: hypothetical protein VEY11_01745 [Pyrinomonadaceae bacterium]|nr:hypothetical protein [Pyrinomonadaceae bacterium]
MHPLSPTRAPRAKRRIETSRAARRASSRVVNSRAVRLFALLILLAGSMAVTIGRPQAPSGAARATPTLTDNGAPAPDANGAQSPAPQSENNARGNAAATPSQTATVTPSPATNPTATNSTATSPAAVQPAASTALAPGQAAAQANILRSQVVDVYKLGEEVKRADDKRSQADWEYQRREAGLNDIIIIKVANLRELLNRAQCIGANAASTCRKQEIMLYLDGRQLTGLVPESGAPTIEAVGGGDGQQSAGDGLLRYHLQRSGESDEHWADLLGFSLNPADFSLRRDVEVSVGLPDEYPIQTAVKDFHLLRVRPYRLIFWLLLFAILGFYLWRLARESDLLRDRKPVLWKQRKPYSLSLTQAAWWFVLVIVAFVFIWLVTGQYDLSAEVLVLLGIGFGTALGSTVIGQNKSATPTDVQTTNAELAALLSDKDSLETELTRLDSDKNRASGDEKVALAEKLDARTTDYNTLIAQIRQRFPEALGWGYINLRTDLVSDSNGANFHRFQMIVWTIVLGFIFIHSVLSRLSMPHFSATLLTLMGISSSAYLVGKSSEPQHITGEAAAVPAGNAAAVRAAATNANTRPADPPA